ncbi:MAG: FadR family transcriptional regulator [Clostridia bacterium]|jgi:GntR family transcriptional repressor for pyruvate dehydrogenase complex|nr:FadR family transcriptional regulator [Clostridia bacterium]MCI2001000.1 FadR family transcriptional regulator [Clostridia bacterium]MCI2015599.1 FadR family transcriptional regulator [Clostridia bacterium]
MEIKSIQTKKIYKNIVEQIVYLIREGSLKSGDKLPPERTLAEMLDVSRASLREALSVMEIMGIVDIRPGEGSFVSDLNVLPFISLVLPLLLKEGGIEDDFLEFRMLLESCNIKLVVKHADENAELLNELHKTVLEMGETVDDPDIGVKLDVKFHSLLFEMSGNVVLKKVYEYIGFILERTVKFNRSKILEQRNRASEIFNYHKQIYEAIVKRDAALSQSLLEKHFELINEAM